MSSQNPARGDDRAPSANVRLIQRVYAAFEAHDFAALPALFDADVVIRQSSELPWGGEFRGLPGAVQFFTGLLESIDTAVEVAQLIDAGDAIVEVGRTRGVASRTGLRLDVAEAHVYTIADGKVTRMEAFVHHPDMLPSIGEPAPLGR
jgi:ketosteroid isomerase-like protein